MAEVSMHRDFQGKNGPLLGGSEHVSGA